jgi:hypothetical protein
MQNNGSIVHAFLISAKYGREWSALGLDHFTRREEALRTFGTRGDLA